MNAYDEIPTDLLAAFARTITPEGVARAREEHTEMWLAATLGETWQLVGSIGGSGYTNALPPASPLPVWRPR